MRVTTFLLVLFAAFVFAGCSKAPATKTELQTASPTALPSIEPPKAAIDPQVVDFLLTSAATDFHEHPPGNLAHFRNVRIGHITADGKNNYRMCGEFAEEGRDGEGEWTPFATIKTSGYEQYIGGLSTAYCQGESFVWDEVGDLSSQLKSRFDSLRQGKK